MSNIIEKPFENIKGELTPLPSVFRRTIITFDDFSEGLNRLKSIHKFRLPRKEKKKRRK